MFALMHCVSCINVLSLKEMDVKAQIKSFQPSKYKSVFKKRENSAYQSQSHNYCNRAASRFLFNQQLAPAMFQFGCGPMKGIFRLWH